MRRLERSWVAVARGGGLDHFDFAPGYGVGDDRCFGVEDLNVRLMIQIQERVLCGKKAVSMRQYGLSGTGGSPLYRYLHQVLAPSLREPHHVLGQNPPKGKLERTHSSIQTLLGCGRVWTVQGMEETQVRSRQCR